MRDGIGINELKIMTIGVRNQRGKKGPLKDFPQCVLPKSLIVYPDGMYERSCSFPRN